MKIRITKSPKLPKAQVGMNNTMVGKNFVTINGITYYEGTPGYEEAVKMADSSFAADQAELAALNRQQTPRQAGQIIPSGLAAPSVGPAPTSFMGQMPNVEMNPVVPNYAGLIPAVNTRAAQFNNLMGIQPQVGLQNAPNVFTPTGQPANNFNWTSTGNQSVPAIPAQPTMYKTQPQAAPDLVGAKNMIGSSINDLKKTLAQGSAKQVKAGIADFNSTYGTELKDPRLIKLGAKGRETFGKIGALSDTFAFALAGANALSNEFQQRKNRRDFDSQMIDNLSSDGMYSQDTTDRGDYVQTGMMNGTLRPDEYVVNKGMFAEQGGTINNTTMKIRILGNTKRMEYGGQAQPAGSFDTGARKVYTDMKDNSYDFVNQFMPEVPAYMANVEAEAGETLYGDVDGDGQNEHMKIGGKPHSQGGTNIEAPEGSFIFSKKLKEKDPAVLKMFGKSFKRGGVSYSDIAKQYDVNKYKAVMEDPNADPIAKSTAQLMVKNYDRKIAQLATAQEYSKGFPQGQPQTQAAVPMMDEGGDPFSIGSSYMPNMFFGANAPAAAAAALNIDPYKGGKQKTPTGKDNKFDRGKEYLQTWEQHIPGISKLSNKQAQDKIYDYVYSQNPEAINSMWSQYGLTNEGKKYKELTGMTGKDAKGNMTYKFDKQLDPEQLKKLKKAYVDGYFGARQLDPSVIKPKETVGTKYKCTPNGVVAVRYDGPIAGGFEQPGLFNSYEEAAAVCQKPGEKKPEQPEEQLPPVENVPGKIPFDYMTPDKVNMFVAAANPPKKYNPYYGQAKLTKPEPTFYDPSRELAANAEQYNIMTQGLANFAGPQGYMANASGAAGRAFENAANTLGRYNNLNVGVANQFAAGNADIDNKQNLLDVERSNQMYMGNVIANQQYDNSRREYMNNMAKSFGQAWNNRMNLDLINQTIPQYYQDPLTGRTVFKGGRSAANFMPGSALNQSGLENFAALKRKALESGMDENYANRYAYTALTGDRNTYTDANMDGIPDMARYTTRG